MRYIGSIPIGTGCSAEGCTGRPVAVAPWRTSQLLFLCEKHADELVEHIAAEDDPGPLTGILRQIIPTCQALVGGTTPCGAASTRVSVWSTEDDFKTSCMCDRHTSSARLP